MGKDKIQEILNNFARATEVRPLILQDVEADGVSGEGAERHRK